MKISTIGVSMTTCVAIVSMLNLVSPSKILMLPVAHYSTLNFYSSVGKTLVREGHEVWILAEQQYEKKLTKGGIHPLAYPTDAWTNNQEHILKSDISEKLAKGILSMMELIPIAIEPLTQLCEETLSNKKLMKQIEDVKFDLVIADTTLIWKCILVIPYKLDIPFMILGAINFDPWNLGIPAMPSFEPSPMSTYTNEMNFKERTINTLLSLVPMVISLIGDDYVSRFAANKPPISVNMLIKKAEMWLSNYEVTCVDYPRVSGPHHIYVGGSSATPPAPLTGDISVFVNEARHGVVVLTFGSFKPFSQVLKYIMPRLLDAFSRIKQRVILQYSEKLDNVPKNVWPMGWLPQNDLLGHPKTVLFISHGGNNGQMEAVHHGVPILNIPVINEQRYNSIKVVSRGYGKMIDLATFTADDLVESIDSIVYNSSYKENILKCSKIIKTYPSPQKHITFWVDHVLKFGGSHLRPPSIDMPLYQMFNLDVCVFLLAVLVKVVILLVWCCRYTIRKCTGYSKHKTE